jgi:hypothetical protein
VHQSFVGAIEEMQLEAETEFVQPSDMEIFISPGWDRLNWYKISGSVANIDLRLISSVRFEATYIIY